VKNILFGFDAFLQAHQKKLFALVKIFKTQKTKSDHLMRFFKPKKRNYLPWCLSSSQEKPFACLGEIFQTTNWLLFCILLITLIRMTE